MKTAFRRALVFDDAAAIWVTAERTNLGRTG